MRDLIESSLSEDLGLERLAAAAGIGAHRFSTAFTREFGISPHQYVIERRLTRARTLLRQVDKPIAAIAYETGFASQSHLTTAFKKAVGTTPGAYRNGRGFKPLTPDGDGRSTPLTDQGERR